MPSDWSKASSEPIIWICQFTAPYLPENISHHIITLSLSHLLLSVKLCTCTKMNGYLTHSHVIVNVILYGVSYYIMSPFFACFYYSALGLNFFSFLTICVHFHTAGFQDSGLHSPRFICFALNLCSHPCSHLYQVNKLLHTFILVQ